MKSILLSSAAIVAFAGAAAAETHTGVSFSGSAELGYNDDALGDNDGFYGSVDLDVSFKAELDNGLTAGVDWDLELAGTTGGAVTWDDAVIYVKSDTAAMYFGVTSFAAEDMWVSAGDMEQDGFSEASDELVLKGTLDYGTVSAAVSYVVADDAGTLADDDVAQLSVGVSADFGNFNVVAAYQEDAAGEFGGADAAGNGDFNSDEVFGLSVGTTFGAADVRLAYASNETKNEDSLGLQVGYSFDPVDVTVYYVDESNGDANWGLTLGYENGPVSVTFDYDDDQGVEKMGIEGSYDVGNGLTIMAGYMTQDATDDRYYVAGEYDLGSGASLLVSHAEDDSNVQKDEIGGPDFQRGTTVELSFEF